jgi:ankyrin repeat domain-containing protein 50
MAIRFRWVQCQLIALRRCRNVKDLKAALKNLPKDLDVTYERMLDHIREEDQKCAKCVLQLIAVAYRPLTIHEVSEALIVDIEKEMIDEEIRMPDPFEILEICSGLIELSKYV